VKAGPFEPARAAHLDVASEGGGATQRNGRQHPTLRRRQALFGLKRGAMLPHDVGDVESWPPG